MILQSNISHYAFRNCLKNHCRNKDDIILVVDSINKEEIDLSLDELYWLLIKRIELLVLANKQNAYEGMTIKQIADE